MRGCGTGVESVKFRAGALASGRDPGGGYLQKVVNTLDRTGGEVVKAGSTEKSEFGSPSSNATSGERPKRTERRDLTRCLHTHVHSSIMHDSRKGGSNSRASPRTNR